MVVMAKTPAYLAAIPHLENDGGSATAAAKASENMDSKSPHPLDGKGRDQQEELLAAKSNESVKTTT